MCRESLLRELCTSFFPITPNQRDSISLVIASTIAAGNGIYLGRGETGPIYCHPQQGALVLGPPRSGKTSACVIPNVLGATGSVVSVSTKRDVLDATLSARSLLGECFVYDPSGSVSVTNNAKRVGWSPTNSAIEWNRAVLTADAMVGAAKSGTNQAESSHWHERAGALLASALHGAALDGLTMRDVVKAVNRHEPERFLSALSRHNAKLALDLLVGITETDDREQSGIWSTTSGVLAAFRTEQALSSSELPQVDMGQFVRSRATLYIAASSDEQSHLAPLVAGVIRDVRSATYEAFSDRRTAITAPTLLVLDELANIAPLHDLPTLLAEGASQGLLTLASLQDLSQARQRWGVAADGFLSLFGGKILFPGIGDLRTLEAVSVLAGDHEVAVHSRTSTRRGRSSRGVTRSVTMRTRRRIDPSDVAKPEPGTAVIALGAEVGRVTLTPYYAHSPWREAAGLRASIAKRRQLLPERRGGSSRSLQRTDPKDMSRTESDITRPR